MNGQLYQHYDGGGKQQVNSYDFKGNPLSTQQQLLDDPAVTDVDWSTDTATGEVFTSTISYDALNRPVSMTDPGGNVTEHTYDAGGMLLTVTLNSDDYVTDIHYDAKGQRAAIWYGNGTKTSYTYDEQTFRLRELKTRRLSDGVLLQDLHYYYDPVGNITSITDGAQQDIFYANTIVTADQSFTYDALYRLIEATGREQIGTASFGSDDNYNDSAWISNLGSDASQTYTQYYTYDAVGNITELQHAAGTGSYTRSYDYDSSSNRLDSTAIGAATYSYTYDDRGNMLTMPHLSALDWNAQNQLSHTERGTTNAYYQYSGGERIRKWVDKGGGLIEERIYLGSYERYRKYVSATTLDVERSTVHISDDTGRIAMTEVLNTDYNTDGADEVLIRYIYSNHLQSASLELNEDGDIISYEEYHPYGTTAWQAKSTSINATAKRYRYTGKERDEETGLYYHGARYYIPWLCRWSAVDPLESKYAPWSSYNYGFDNPVKWNDPSGMGPGDKDKVPTADNTSVAHPPITYNLYNAPDGSILTLPITAKVESTFGKGEATANGVTIHPLEGSVWNFSYKNELYGAQFDSKGAFTGYQSYSDPGHRLGFEENTTPKVDPNSNRNQQLSLAGLSLSTGVKGNIYVTSAALVLSSILVWKAFTAAPSIDLPIGLTRPLNFSKDDVDKKPITIVPPLDIIDTKPNDDNVPNIYIHYSNESSILSIAASQRILPNEKGNIYLTKTFMSPERVENEIFIGNPAYKGKGDYMVVFKVDPDQQTNISPVPGNVLEYVHNAGTLKIRPGNLLYIGPNKISNK